MSFTTNLERIEGPNLQRGIGRELYYRLVKAAVAAPSADNNQPWKFSHKSNSFEVHWDRSRKLPSDLKGAFDILSLGAAIENVVLQASVLGYDTTVAVCSISKELDTAQTIKIACIDILYRPAEQADTTGLAHYIDQRKTNRYSYETTPISEKMLQTLSQSIDASGLSTLYWETNPDKIKQLGSLVALSDSLRFRCQTLHEELYQQFRLTKKHANKSRDGLDYRTLALPFGGRSLLKTLRPWFLMRTLNLFGFARFLSGAAKSTVTQSGAIGFIYSKDQSIESLLNTGRSMQRIWLSATKLGLSLHPIGSLPVALADNSLPCELQKTKKVIRSVAQSLLPSTTECLQLAFRIGSEKRRSTTSSLRRRIDDVTIPSDKNSTHDK